MTTIKEFQEFDEKFVTPLYTEMRAMNLNNEPCVMGTSKDVEQFISHNFLPISVLEQWMKTYNIFSKSAMEINRVIRVFSDLQTFINKYKQ